MQLAGCPLPLQTMVLLFLFIVLRNENVYKILINDPWECII